MCGWLQSGRYLGAKSKIAEQKLFSIHIWLKMPQMKWTTHNLTLQAAEPESAESQEWKVIQYDHAKHKRKKWPKESIKRIRTLN